MTLDFNFKLKDLSGTDLDTTAGKVLGNYLAGLNKNNSIKLFDWAMKFWNGQPVEIDDTDFSMLETLIDTGETMNALAKGPMLKYMKSVKAETK